LKEDEPTPYEDLADVPPRVLELSRRVIGLAIAIHRELGPGLPEEAYELAMCIELKDAGIRFSQQHLVQVPYKGVIVARVRLDLLIEDCLIVETKSVEAITPIHRIQLTRYLHILNLPMGLLLNFNVPMLKDGIRRIIRTQSNHS